MKYDNLKNARNTNGYTCEFMAHKLKISTSYYSQIENGKRKLEYCMAVKISSIFGLQPDDIFYRYYEKYKIKSIKKNLTVISIFPREENSEGGLYE